jgi:hypothetical protein
MSKKRKEKPKLIERTQVVVAQDRKAARLNELLSRIRRKMVSMAENFYDIGECLREILDKKLFEAAGHTSLDEMLDAEKLISRRQAGKLIAVVRKVSREHALSMGHEKAYALLAYIAVTPKHDSVAILLESRAKIAGKPVADASLREIVRATLDVRTQEAAKRPKTDAELKHERADKALLRTVRDALQTVGVSRPAVQITGDEVRIVLSRTQAERLITA